MTLPDESKLGHSTGTRPQSTQRSIPPVRPTALSLLLATRPKQWLKNLLVFAAPAAAADLGNQSVLSHTLVALLSFILASCSIYLLNDTADIDLDRMHPRKRFRPIASGAVSPRLAITSAIVLMASSLGATALSGRYQLTVVIAVYLALNIAYVYWTKHQPMLDMVSVALGFLLRAIAGGAASHIPLSNWFLIVASFGSLLMVTGKRSSELKLLGDSADQHRASLSGYSANFLYFVAAVAAAITVTGYCLWAFERSSTYPHIAILYQISIAPFVLGVLRYALLIDQGEAGAPEDLVLNDRALQVIGLVWIVALGLSIYL